MKKLYFLAISFFSLSASTFAQTYQNIVATAPVDAIWRTGGCGYNTQPGMNNSSIAIPLNGTISDPSKITFNLSLKAAWLGDVSVELVDPQGNAITLIRRLGAVTNRECGDSSTFVPGNIIGFNSQSVTQIDAGAIAAGFPIPPGNYAPTYSAANYPRLNPGNLTSFLTGKQINGEWRLYIYDYGEGESSSINSWQIIIGAGAFLKNSETGTFTSEISLQQNPVQDYLSLNVDRNFKTLVCEIYDASGKVIKKEIMSNSKNDLTIDVKTLTPGIYLLTPIKDGERQKAIKFIKK